ncbi:sulfotransferase [Sphingomonas sp. RB56-2]|uniref:Sulfotransferase n=1 Tax=Sphingomonas brevis TaxID=2908206 RepID=A0ABT0SA53_9SPHN|nr:tetratricopeptide repeat-containing sulfotransferase family protein [Sphingomonas brevis]MCL6741257.1 sulfotransferase [Sphingomonas brevis]
MNLPNMLSEAAQLHARGDLLGARRRAEEALAADPKSVVALQFVGVLYCQTGEPGLGADFLTSALKQSPSDLPTRLNAMQALMDSGRVEEADKLGRDAPPSTSAAEFLRLRASIAKRLGNIDEALGFLKRAVEAAPNDHAAWNNLGNALHEADDTEGAVEALRRAVELRPDAAFVHVNLGRALATADRHQESLSQFEEASRLDPNDGIALFEIGKALVRMGHPTRALPFLGKAASLRRDDSNIFLVMGLAFARLDDLEKAEQAYRLAIQTDPNSAAAYLNVAILMERGNRTEELVELQEKALAHGVKGQEADFVQALVYRREGKLEDALRLAQQSHADSLDSAIRSNFIGEVADRLGDAETAFAAFAEMNRITARRPDAVVYDPTQWGRFIEGLTEKTTAEWFAKWQPVVPKNDPPAPAFLVGFFRSGTTLLDTILMGHPAAQVIEEQPMIVRLEESLGGLDRLPDLDGAAVDALRDRYFAELPEPLVPGKLLIDKNPLATRRAPLIHRIFPDARFIFALRHPCDVVLSCFMQNFQVSEAMVSFLDLTNAALLYDRAMTFWQKCQEIFPLNVHAIRYEEMVADTEGELRKLLAFLGLPWDDKVLDHQKTALDRGYIRTPSYAQVTEGIYVRAKGRWEKYRKQMEPVLPILAPWVERFGYEPLEL